MRLHLHNSIVRGTTARESLHVGVHIRAAAGCEGRYFVLLRVRESFFDRVPTIDVVSCADCQLRSRQSALQFFRLLATARVGLEQIWLYLQRCGYIRLGILSKTLGSPAEAVRITNAVLVLTAISPLAQASPLAWQARDGSMNGAGATVGEVKHNVVIVNGRVVEG